LFFNCAITSWYCRGRLELPSGSVWLGLYEKTTTTTTRLKSVFKIIIIFSSPLLRRQLSPVAAAGSRHSSVASSSSSSRREHLSPITRRPGPCQCTIRPRDSRHRDHKTPSEPVFSYYGTITPPPTLLLL